MGSGLTIAAIDGELLGYLDEVRASNEADDHLLAQGGKRLNHLW